MKVSINISLSVEGFHCWPEAPVEVSFLRNSHRHNFVIYCEKEVEHADRAIEIICFKREIQKFLANKFGSPCQFGRMSCEEIAILICRTFGCSKCRVLEDGENGATVEGVARESRRIWVGPELEGKDKGEPTLFIQAETIDSLLLRKVVELSAQYNTKRLYFGAGKVDVKRIDASVELLDKEGYEIICETSYSGISAVKEWAATGYNIIVRTELEGVALAPNIFAKLESKDKVVVYSTGALNKTISIENGMYDEDVLVWEE